MFQWLEALRQVLACGRLVRLLLVALVVVVVGVVQLAGVGFAARTVVRLDAVGSVEVRSHVARLGGASLLLSGARLALAMLLVSMMRAVVVVVVVVVRRTRLLRVVLAVGACGRQAGRVQVELKLVPQFNWRPELIQQFVPVAELAGVSALFWQ